MNESLTTVEAIEENTKAMVALRDDLRHVHEEVFCTFLENADESITEQYERKKKILTLRRRMMTFVSSAREAEVNAKLQLAEAAKSQEHYDNNWQRLSDAEKDHLKARIDAAKVSAQNSVDLIKQCEMELQFDLAYAKRLMEDDQDGSERNRR